MGFMNWLMKGVGFENEQVYDNTYEKQKLREDKQNQISEKKRKKEEYKAKKAQEKADRMAKKLAVKQAKDVQDKPQSTTTSFAQNPDQYNIQNRYTSPSNSYGMNTNVGGYGSKNVEFVYPMRFEDVTVVINYLKEGESVVLNLNNMNPEDAQRLLDCTSGAIRALNGNIMRVDSNIFLLTPEGFNIRTPDEKPQNNV